MERIICDVHISRSRFQPAYLRSQSVSAQLLCFHLITHSRNPKDQDHLIINKVRSCLLGPYHVNFSADHSSCVLFSMPGGSIRSWFHRRHQRTSQRTSPQAAGSARSNINMDSVSNRSSSHASRRTTSQPPAQRTAASSTHLNGSRSQILGPNTASDDSRPGMRQVFVCDGPGDPKLVWEPINPKPKRRLEIFPRFRRTP